MTIARRLLIAVALVLVAPMPTAAHPTATTSVTLAIAAGSCTVTLVSHGEALALTLEALAGRGGPVAGADSVARIVAAARVLEARATLTADGRAVPLTVVRVAPLDDGSPRVVVTMTASLPDGTTAVRWQTSLVAGAYPLFVQDAGDPEPDDRTPVAAWLNAQQHSPTFALSDVRATTASPWSLVWIGLTHIVPKGLDHILFVLGLFLLARRARDLVLQISAFTLAHSLTLLLAVTGRAAVPPGVVEPMIALSIVYVAVENLRATSLTRWRLLLVFGFGLLHGLGFADALVSLGVGSGQLLRAILAFNVGVELGQLVVVGAAAVVVGLTRLPRPAYERWVVRPASVAIAAAGMFWMIERLG